MTERTVSFDRAGYSLDAVQRAAYRLSDSLSVEIVQANGSIDATLHIPPGDSDPDLIVANFRNEVLDQVLRERIREETADVRNLILAVAFSKTGLADRDV